METKRRIRPELEGLRAIAALLVAVYHIWFNRVSGGVDVFFVVSGFLITTSLLSMYQKNDTIFYFSYILKLLKRLLPTAWLIGITTFIASLSLLPVFMKQQNLNEFLASAFYFQNWRLASDSVDYLAQNNTASPFQHFWALSIQFQFYLIWLLLFFIALTVMRLISGDHMKRVLIILISIIAAMSFGYSVYLTNVNQPVAYYHTLTRVWEFGIGGILALIIHKIVLSPRLAWLFGWMGLIGLISCGIILQVSELFPGYAALWPVLSAVLIIMAGNYSVNFSAFRLLSLKPLVAFGSISYAFYLWHWPFLIFYYAVFDVEAVSVFHGLLIIIAAAAFAYMTIYGFEIPIRKVQLPIWKTTGIIAAFSAVIWISALSYQEIVLESASVNSDLLNESFSTHPGAATYLIDGRLTPANEYEEPFLPSLEVAPKDMSEIYGDGCIYAKTEPKICEYGSLENYEYTVALVGGSHSAQWQPMLAEIADEHNIKIVTYLKGNCRFTFEDSLDFPECDVWFEKVTNLLVELDPDLIFTVGDVGEMKEEYDKVPEGFIEAWKYFEKHDIPLFLVQDTPWYKENNLICLSENTDAPESCKKKKEEVFRDPSPLSQVDYLPESATTIEVDEYFCDDEYCHSVVGNIITHFDNNHITATFAKSFAPVFEKPLLEALENP